MTLDQGSLSAHFGLIRPVHMDAFCDLLVVLRRHFGGDLDRMMVLAIIGSRTLSRSRIDGMSYDRFITLKRPDEEPPPIDLQSIADASGIPRKTVRRKVKDLEQAGWIIRRDNGYVIASARAAHDLAPATEATLRYLATVVTACNAAIVDR
jgi:biotin operon repressor